MPDDAVLGAERTDSITVRDLTELPFLQLSVLAGESGLDNPVSWAHVTDSHEPWNWLEPGDLVLTSGLIVPCDREAQASFIERLAGTGLSGLVVSEDERCPPLSDLMYGAADRLGFPLLMVSYGVSFAQFGRVVAAANERGENRSLSMITRVHSEAMAWLLEQRSGADGVNGLARVVHCDLRVVDPETWEPLIAGCPAPDISWKRAYDAELEKRDGGVPFVMRLVVGDDVALTTPIPTERPACVIAFPDHDETPRLAVLQQVAATCALEVVRIDANVERERRSGASLVHDALNSRMAAPALDALLHARGFRGELSVIAVDGQSQAVDRMARSWVIREIPFLLGSIAHVSIGVIRTEDVEDLAQRSPTERWRVGVSDSFSGAVGIQDAVRQARWALETVAPDGSSLALYGDGSPSFLPRTLAECQAAVDRILGPIIAYDREHDADLVKTLHAYLECDRSPSQASKVLFVHAQTVNYRLARVQELTGRSIRSTADVSELWLALRALNLSQTTD